VRSDIKVILASGSPRRRELLLQLIAGFDVDPADIDESPLPQEDPWQLAERIAFQKARQVSIRHSEALVIGGDTVVALPRAGGYEMLAKPADAAEAACMLGRLSGREHIVVTGIALVQASGAHVFSDTTHVRFRSLTEAEIQEYIATGEPMDKAGAYAIQGGAKQFVEAVRGSTSNVIGLPLEKLGQALEAIAPSSGS
jgi:septum formation protein